MNERRLQQLNILVIIATVVGVCMMLFFAFFIRGNENRRITLHMPDTMNDSWVLTRQGDEAQTLIDIPDRIKVKPGEILTIAHAIPDAQGDDVSLCFYTEFQNVIVYVGGTRVYESGVLDNNKIMKNAVPGYHVVDIDRTLGDTVTIQLASYYRRYSGKITSVYIGSHGDIVAWLIERNGIPYVVSLMLVVLTVLLGISLLFMTNENINKQKAAYGFGFILFVAAWIFFGNAMMQLITKNQFATYMASQIFLLLMPVLYFMYLRSFAMKRRYARIFEIMIYVYSVNFLTGVVFQLVGVCDFASYMFFTKILILLGLVMLCFIMYLAADTYADKSIYSNFWANVILTASCLVEFGLQFFRFYKNFQGLVLQIGVFVFAVLLMISIEKTIIQEMNAERDAALSSVGHEKSQAVRTIDTAYIYSALNTAIKDLKDRDPVNSRLIYDTSVFMQHNMDAVYKNGLVPFTEELQYIRAYLGMARRIHPGLEVLVEDKVTDFQIPYSTIEPFVENAVCAAVEKQKAKVVVRSYERLDCYAIQIVDNGNGVSPAKKFRARQNFQTLQKELKKSVGALLDIRVKPDKGTILTVKIPKQGYIVKE